MVESTFQERDAAKKLFSGKKGEVLQKDIAAKRSKTFEVKDVVTATKEDAEFMAAKYKDQEAIKVGRFFKTMTPYAHPRGYQGRSIV